MNDVTPGDSYKIINTRISEELDQLYKTNQIFLALNTAGLSAVLLFSEKLDILETFFVGTVGFSISFLWFLAGKKQKAWFDWWTKQARDMEEKMPIKIWTNVSNDINPEDDKRDNDFLKGKFSKYGWFGRSRDLQGIYHEDGKLILKLGSGLWGVIGWLPTLFMIAWAVFILLSFNSTKSGLQLKENQEKQTQNTKEMLIVEDLSEAENPDILSPEEVAMYVGAYEFGEVGKRSGILMIKEDQTGGFDFLLDVNRGAPSYNSGRIVGELTFENNIGTYITAKYGGICELTFEFQEDKMIVTQNEEYFGCGFGHAVYANGEYLKTSSESPEFY